MNRKIVQLTSICVTIILSVFLNTQSASAQNIEDLKKVQESINQTQLTWTNVAIFIGVTILGIIFGRIASFFIRRYLNKITDLNKRYANIVARTANTIIIGIAFITGLGYIGIDLAWVSTIFLVISVLLFLTLKPLLQSVATSILLLSRSSFEIGSQICIDDYRGDVIDINARSVVIRSRDWKKIHIPNQIFLEKALTVYDNLEHRRSEVVIDIDVNTDLEKISKKLIEGLKKTEYVLDKPEPSTRLIGFADNSATMRVRWCHKADLSSESRSKDAAVITIQKVLKKENVTMPVQQ